ncbi:hypothetical protein N0V85_008169, partial [Neurospora sp. IMI 360204]
MADPEPLKQDIGSVCLASSLGLFEFLHNIVSADGRTNVLAILILAIIVLATLVLAIFEKINLFVAIEFFDQLGDMIPLASLIGGRSIQ